MDVLEGKMKKLAWYTCKGAKTEEDRDGNWVVFDGGSFHT